MTISTQADGRYLDVNDAFLALVGSERGSVVGHTMAELAIWVEPQDRITMTSRLNEQGRVIGLPAQIRARTGVVLEVGVSAEQIELLGQLCVLMVTEDTTEMRLLQAQAEQSKKMEAVGRLAGGVAHDFNNLLGVIMGYSELSIETLDPKTQTAKHLVQIKLAAAHGAHLTRQLLLFSRQQVVFLKVLDINAVIHEASKLLGRVVREDPILSYQISVSVETRNPFVRRSVNVPSRIYASFSPYKSDRNRQSGSTSCRIHRSSRSIWNGFFLNMLIVG